MDITYTKCFYIPVCISYGTTPRILSFESLQSGRRKRRFHTDLPASVTATSASTCEEGYSSSPYPPVDSFITSCVTKGGIQGAIRRWSYFQQGGGHWWLQYWILFILILLQNDCWCTISRTTDGVKIYREPIRAITSCEMHLSLYYICAKRFNLCIPGL